MTAPDPDHIPPEHPAAQARDHLISHARQGDCGPCERYAAAVMRGAHPKEAVALRCDRSREWVDTLLGWMVEEFARPLDRDGGEAVPPHPFAPIPLVGLTGPINTDWCGYWADMHDEETFCGRLAGDPVHTAAAEPQARPGAGPRRRRSLTADLADLERRDPSVAAAAARYDEAVAWILRRARRTGER